MARQRNRAPRRGVVLLVILSLLVLFALLGVTFVIVSGQYKRSAGVFSRAESYGDDWARQADTAMYIALRDSLDVMNPLRSHSLLNDIYGHDSYYGTVSSASNASLGGGQLVDIQCTLTNLAGGALPSDANVSGYFNGCVLTFYRPAGAAAGSNRLAGNSTRIVGSSFDSSTGGFVLLAMRPTADNSNDVLLKVGDKLLINGKAFSGMGAGYNLATGNLDLPGTTSGLAALEPNRRGESNAALGNGYGTGRMHENWDAADLQNLFLSATIPDASHPSGIKHLTINGKQYPCIIPSFHRPALIKRDKGMTRTNSFRPYAGDHPNFPLLGDQSLTGTNPEDPAVYGPWDVDNDGDGVADSVWIDLNLPVQTSPDGRRYKPLFAIKIEDLDNRLNVNFQGNELHYATKALTDNLYFADGTTQADDWSVKGTGLGPPEVALSLGLGMAPAQLQYLLEGNGALPGRYGFDKVPGSGASGTPTTLANDAITTARFYEWPANFFYGNNYTQYDNPAYIGPTFQSAPDLLGQLARGVGTQGQLVMDVPTASTDLRERATYRTRLSYDSRFAPTELERILRYYDVDVLQLPSRLEVLAQVLTGGSVQAAVNRRLVTTHSYDVPVANPTATRTISQSGNVPILRDPLGLLRKRLGGSMLSETQILSLVDRDFYFGLKMNINRPLGDGIDNNNNGVIDEQDQNEATAAFNQGANVVNGEDTNGNGTVDAADQLYARHLLAKHLYILASLCVDTGASPNAAVQQQLAQWAINVVDFRDADSINTPFEYDPNPFDGWNSACDGMIGDGVNGAVETINDGVITAGPGTRGLVWGLERPELLLTETFVAHDRRTSDEDDEDPVDPAGSMAAKTTEGGATMNPDTDFDQKYLPQGLAFIELYAPWRSQVERRPVELYSNPTTGGVVLNKKDVASGTTPVWRMLVVKGPGQGIDPDTQDSMQRTLLKDNTDRSVYFTDPSGLADDEDGTRYFADHAINPVVPGAYAVVGSGPPSADNDGNYVTYLGLRNDYAAGITAATDAELKTTRRFILNPTAVAPTPAFQVANNGHTAQPEPNYGNQVQPVVAVVVNKAVTAMGAGPERFTFSEPAGGYTLGTHQKAAELPGQLVPLQNSATMMTKPLDVPLDLKRTDIDDGKELYKDGVLQQWRFVHLQRLANPLLPWNKYSNPYLTIDTIGSDIYCFNGINAQDDKLAGGGSNPNACETLQRGDPSPSYGATPERVLWRRTTRQTLEAATGKIAATPEADDKHFNGYKLHHTLGYLNTEYGRPYPLAASIAPDKVNGDAIVDGTSPTFPWLTWNNRPFNSVYELMDVPMTKSSLLTREYKIPSTLSNPYVQDQNNYAFGHLPNFYYDQPGNQVNGLYRIFDYLRVPSKFVEAETMLKATVFATNDSNALNPFHPPFNWVPNFRDPGLININTIYHRNVWNAVLGGDPTQAGNQIYGLGASFEEMVASRRGYGTSAEITELDTTGGTPTEFANPFRAAGTGSMGNTIAAMNPANPIDVTMLRPDKNGGTNPPNLPLLGNANGSNAATSNASFNNSARHSYFRHQTLQRLSNTLTTRSNVYACWITVGYFEVDSSGALGQELHADTGEIKRHRAFYMIDRTIPVGFEPGENHNVDRAILVRRYIE